MLALKTSGYFPSRVNFALTTHVCHQRGVHSNAADRYINGHKWFSGQNVEKVFNLRMNDPGPPQIQPH